MSKPDSDTRLNRELDPTPDQLDDGYCMDCGETFRYVGLDHVCYKTLRKLEADSERLDWLEETRPRVGLGENGEARLLARDREGALLASRPTLREAIDTARRISRSAPQLKDK